MAKPTRGLPASYSLELPDNIPTVMGDYLDENPPMPRRVNAPEPQDFRPQLVPDRARHPMPVRPVREKSRSERSARFQLNLNAQSKQTFEDFVKHVQTYSPEFDARHSEVFQAIIALLDDARGELDLESLPRRGAWGSLSARNFIGALTSTFEQAIVKAAKKRGAA